MLNGLLEALVRHKQMISVVVAAVAIALYMIPINSVHSNSVSASNSGIYGTLRSVSSGFPAVTSCPSTSCIISIPPAFIVNQPGGTFMRTPVIAKIFPGLNVLIHQSIKTNFASVEQIQMKFAEGGTNVGFTFGISGNIPSAFRLPVLPVNTVALFLNIGFVGQVVTKFSSPAAFESSPLIQILVSKALATTKLTDGCPDIGLYTFNESTGHWLTLSKPIRTGAIDKPGECGFTLEPGHFSKFAVGGIKLTLGAL